MRVSYLLQISMKQFGLCNLLPLRFVGLIALTLFMVVGCAGLPPAQPVRDISTLAGKWRGSFPVQNNFYTATLTINEDGTFEDLIPGFFQPRQVGKITVVDGKYRLDNHTSGRMYTVTLYEGDGRRVLVKVPDDSSISSVQFLPIK